MMPEVAVTLTLGLAVDQRGRPRWRCAVERADAAEALLGQAARCLLVIGYGLSPAGALVNALVSASEGTW